MSKISILVPVYKVEKYLERCLDSILAQTFTDWECILIDDGSPDNSGKICDEYAKKDERFVVLHQESNKGVAAARNIAFNKASADYFICVDSDDWVEPNYLEELYNKAINTNADVIGCNLVKEFVHKSMVTKNLLPETSGECIKALLQGDIQGWLHVKMIKKSILVDNNISCVEGLDLWEDVLITLKIFSYAKRIYNVDKYLYHYRFNNQSLVNTFNEKRINDLIGIVKNIEMFLKENELLDYYYEYFNVLKVRVKVSILCESNIVLQKKYKTIYSEVDGLISKEQHIAKIKKLATKLILNKRFYLGNFLLLLLKLGRKIKYR